VVHLLPAAQGRQRATEADPHPAWRRVRPAQARLGTGPVLRRVALRTKLVATVAVRVIAAEAGFGVAATVLMRDHLLAEVHRELTAPVGRLRVEGPLAFFNPGLPAVGQVDPPAACQPLPSAYLVYVRSPAQGFGVATYCE